MAELCDAGDEVGEGVLFGCILLVPGVMTIGLPFMSSAYLKPTATASGLFRWAIGETVPSYELVPFTCKSLLRMERDSLPR